MDEKGIQSTTIENYSALSIIEWGLVISIMNELITQGSLNQVMLIPFVVFQKGLFDIIPSGGNVNLEVTPAKNENVCRRWIKDGSRTHRFEFSPVQTERNL